jgi:hypothetical protein
MYSNNFVVSILKEGTPLREVNGTVAIPFESQYQIRIKNKSGVRAQFEVLIDGTNINTLGRYIINSGDTVTLERFMGVSLNDGKKFKFVSVDDSRVSDPTSSENGRIEVKLWKEKIAPVITWTHNDSYVDYDEHYPTQPFGKPDHYSGTWIYDCSSSARDIPYNFNAGTSSRSVSNLQVKSSFIGSPGATVEGGRSNQQFVNSCGFELENYFTAISLKLVGPEQQPLPYTIHSTPYYTQKFDHKVDHNKVTFCRKCGNKRDFPDNFCPRCGARYKNKK